MDLDPVKLPFADNPESDLHWALIDSALTDLKLKCTFFQTQGLQQAIHKHGNSTFWFRDAISLYNSNAKSNCNFNVIQTDSGILWKLLNLLPQIIDHALSLPAHIRRIGPIYILKQGNIRVNVLDRITVCSLIANAFLCTFPCQNDKKLSSFSFRKLFHKAEDDSRTKVKREKINCFLEYFEKMGDGTLFPNTIISFERYSDSEKVDWGRSTQRLSKLEVIFGASRIEDAIGMLQVDFANQRVGGGILSEGCVQEEIRFCINPELLVSRLFTERLGSDEVLIVTGTRRFCDYKGYGRTFECVTRVNESSVQLPVDDYGRERVQIVAMDAIPFWSEDQSRSQFRKEKIDRELHKSYVGFKPANFLTPIATGNWGCGAFNGDPELKFLIQWMAASVNECRPVLYHASSDAQKMEFDEMVKYLTAPGKRVEVGALYAALIRYERFARGRQLGNGAVSNLTVFQYMNQVF